jgi:hypothetical protein
MQSKVRPNGRLRRVAITVPLLAGLIGAAVVATGGKAVAMPNLSACDRVATLVVTAQTEASAQYWLGVGHAGGCW